MTSTGAGLSAPLRPPDAFATARLAAAPPRPEEAPEAFAVYAADSEATRFLVWPPYTAAEPLAEFFRQRAAGWERGDGDYPFLLRRRDDGALIGSIGVVVAEPEVSFGYVLGRAYWGQGYATEALRWLVDWALAEPRVRRIWACCAVDHAASARVMQKAGLVREPGRRREVLPNLGPEPRDCLVCARTK
jgi:RimJ/RimL family protein N-acetyltransferase